MNIVPLSRASREGSRECLLCPQHCKLNVGQTGLCHTRYNDGENIISLNYGKYTSLALDPIEKKPLARFYPGTYILSVGSFGCNLRCPFCQNHVISQAGIFDIDHRYLPPAQLIEIALHLRQEEKGSIGIAFTYNEPLIGYEYVYETSLLAKEHDLKIVVVTNGLICREPFEALLPYVDALNIDLKGWKQDFYSWTGAPEKGFETVKESIQLALKHAHVEVTTLVIPTKNDSLAEMEAEAKWLASISPEIPLHITRYFPKFKCDIPATSKESIEALCTIARKYLHYVYAGNCN